MKSIETKDENLPPRHFPGLEDFLAFLAHERGFSGYTLRNYRRAVVEFLSWMRVHGKWQGDLSQIQPRQLRNYVIESQRTLSKRTLHNRVSGLRTYFKWALREGLAESNPTTGLVLPKLEKTLPRYLTEAQMKALLHAPTQKLNQAGSEELSEKERYNAWRDRLALELLYGAGLRVSEVSGLTFGQIDRKTGIIRVKGKGKKERLVPMGPVAGEVLDYCVNTFQRTSGFHDRVLTTWPGKPYSDRRIQLMLKQYLAQVNLPNDLTPHKIRHSFATHMLDHGAELRALQAMLGHSSLSTTQVYTHVSISRLKDAHKQAHPRS